MLNDVATMIIIFFRHNDDFRNQSNITIELRLKEIVCAESEADVIATAVGESDSEEIEIGV